MKKGAKLVLSICILVFNALCCFTACFAWFSAYKQSETNGIALKTELPQEMTINCAIFPVLEITDSSYEYDTTSTLEEICLPTYDTCEILSSKYKKALVLDFTFTVEDIDVGNYNLSVDCSDASFGRNEDDRNVSNIISFYPASASVTNTVSASNIEQTFITQDIINEIGTSASCEKDTHLDLTDFAVTSSQIGMQLHLYYVVLYNQRAIGYYTNTNVVNFDFADDLTFKVKVCEN